MAIAIHPPSNDKVIELLLLLLLLLLTYLLTYILTYLLTYIHSYLLTYLPTYLHITKTPTQLSKNPQKLTMSRDVLVLSNVP
jgi:hypothetical protein